MAQGLSLKPSAAICVQLLLGALVIVGVALPMKSAFYSLAVYAAFSVVMLNAALGGSQPMARLFTRDRSKRGEALRALAWTVYLTLYLTSCVLCPRLNIGIFHTHSQLWAWFGAALVVLGTVVILARQKLVAYPKYSALLLTMTGFSLANLAWFPLTALPGILVVGAWQIKSDERLKIGSESHNIEEQSNRPRFKIVPFIY